MEHHRTYQLSLTISMLKTFVLGLPSPNRFETLDSLGMIYVKSSHKWEVFLFAILEWPGV